MQFEIECTNVPETCVAVSVVWFGVFISNFMCAVQDVIVHECTGHFYRYLLSKYLHMYKWETLVIGADRLAPVAQSFDGSGIEARPFLLSPVHFGWPMHRPRLYSVGCLRSKCYMDEPVGLNRLPALFAKPGCDSSEFLCAPSAALLNSADTDTKIEGGNMVTWWRKNVWGIVLFGGCEEMVDAERARAAIAATKPKDSSFDQLLKGAFSC